MITLRIGKGGSGNLFATPLDGAKWTKRIKWDGGDIREGTIEQFTTMVIVQRAMAAGIPVDNSGGLRSAPDDWFFTKIEHCSGAACSVGYGGLRIFGELKIVEKFYGRESYKMYESEGGTFSLPDWPT